MLTSVPTMFCASIPARILKEHSNVSVMLAIYWNKTAVHVKVSSKDIYI